MEDEFSNLLYSQQRVVDGMEKLFSNFKKDGKERKTQEYIKRKLDTLDLYWQEFERTHASLLKFENQENDYFIGDHYTRCKNFYTSVRGSIVQAGSTPLLKPATLIPVAPESAHSTPSGSKQSEDQKASASGLQHSKQNPYKSAPQTPVEEKTMFHQGVSHGTSSLACRSQETSNKLDELLRKQNSNFKALSRTIDNIKLDSICEKWEYNDILKNLEIRWSTIDKLHWEIDSIPGEEDEFYEELFNKYEKKYNDIKRDINMKLWSAAHREKSTPQLEIPVFNGNYQQWTSFKDLFIEAIHNNPCLSNAQRMQFLKSKIKGEPERLIQHLPISSENYTTAWDIMNKRYNNKKLIFKTHMDTLMSLTTMQKASVQHIKRMHDVTIECLNAIKNLGINIDNWDPIIVYLLTPKLDTETHDDYMTSLKAPRELPNLQEFLEFLEAKFTAMESSRYKQEPLQQKTSNPSTQSNAQSSSRFKKYFSSNKATSNKPRERICPVCKKDHGIYFCDQFKEMSPASQRQVIAKLELCSNCLHNHKGKRCVSTRVCQKCNDRHNTLLHDAYAAADQNFTSQSRKSYTNAMHVAQEKNSKCSETLLATALIQVKASDGNQHTLRALVDQGSQVSLITEKAAQKLKLSKQKCNGIITGVGTNDNICKGITSITCTSLRGGYTFDTDVFIMKTLTRNLPNSTFLKPEWKFLEKIELADPEFYLSKPIDILLGAEVYANIILERVQRENQACPLAQETRLGWILCGKVQNLHCNVVLNNMEALHKFWEIEGIGQETTLSSEEQECIAFFQSTTIRLQDGRYQVRLPLKSDVEAELGDSKNKAIAQFRHLEFKFAKNKTMAAQYKLFIDEYLQLGHMIPASSNKTPQNYLPHHCVLREDSTTTSLRVVFNASAKTSNGRSLNDLMHKGPNLQQDIMSLILRWRQHRIAFVADIEKMFRQIWVHPEDQSLQKIIWRDSPRHRLQEFLLATVTYGTKAAPFLAMMTLKMLAEDERARYPEAAQVVETCFYMDDLLHGADTISSAKQLSEDLMQLLKSGGFNLRKWRSNCPTLLQEIGKSECDKNTYMFRGTESMKTLGLNWEPSQDVFTFQFIIDTADNADNITKRKLLSEISKLFDPLGWLTPLSTQMKLLFQEVWSSDIQWDDKVPEKINKDWLKIKNTLSTINNINIPRWLYTEINNKIELHGFCDASQKAYACVIYCKTSYQSESRTVLLVAKSKLVPNKKKISLPKLELCGAYLLAELMKQVRNNFGNNFNIKMFGWVDSTAVLGWIQGDPQRWKIFVANRVRLITETMPVNCWRYVKSTENPADCASRGLNASQLQEHTLWWRGPEWLSTFQEENHNVQKFCTEEERNKQVQFVQIKNENKIILELLEKYSSFTKLVHVLGWIRRLFSNKEKRSKTPYLTVKEIRETKSMIVKEVQQTEFKQEIEDLKEKKQVSKGSKLSSLNPFLDADGLIRVGGRLRHANISSEMKYPIILPHNGRLTELIITHAHELTFHGGARVTLAFIRQKYWIVGGNNAVKKQVRRCVTCKKQNPVKQSQIMGDLPEARSNPSRPFQHTGVDFTGHVFIKSNKGRGIKTTKGYVAVFVCMATKAVHLELVSDLTTSGFIAALRRMAARRGAPQHMYSDNGRNFLGASRCLEQEYQDILRTINEEFFAEITDMEITWHFNAACWPSAGGLWEAAVKSFKFHLKRVIGEQKLTYEEFTTLLAQIEGCLNSRPLCPLSEDPEDIDYLTPAHFLVGGPTLTLIETENDQRTRWNLTQKILHDLWNRWRSEYLIQLAARSKWKFPKRNVQINDVVLIHDDNLPPGKWSLGRVIQLHQGHDGYVRVVTLKTKSGIIKRPIVKISLLLEQETTNNKSQENDKIMKPQVNTTQVRKLSVSSIFTLLLLFMTCISSSQGFVNITKFRQNQNLYFDKVSDMSLIRDEWKLIVYYDLQPYWDGIDALEKLINSLKETCNKIRDQAHCDAVLLQLNHGFSELEYYNHMLLTQHASTRRVTRRAQLRQRRGLINGVGYIANSLFGVLDERFAEQYQKDITIIRSNQNHIINLWKNQTSIVEAEYNLLKRSESVMNQQYKLIYQHINSIDRSFNNMQSEVQRNFVLSSFNLDTTIASNMLHNLKQMQNTLLDTVTDIYNGRFNYQLLSPEQLIVELGSISSKISKEVSLPIEDIHSEFRKIYDLFTVKTRLLENILIFEIRIPLISRDFYEILKLISVPNTKKQEMISVVPISDYISINMKRDVFIPLSEYEMKDCLVLSGKYYCQLRSPEYKIKDDNSFCQIKLTECKTTTELCKDVWTQTSSLNSYFYFCCNTCHIRTMCENQVNIHQLTQAGLINIGHGCSIKTEALTIFPHKMHTSEIKMKPDVYAPNIAPINYIVNITIPTLQNSLMNTSQEAEQELTAIGERIQQLKNQNILSSDISFHDVHHYAAIYVILGSMVLIGGIIAFRKLKRRWSSGEGSRTAGRVPPPPSPPPPPPPPALPQTAHDVVGATGLRIPAYARVNKTAYPGLRAQHH